MSFNVAMVILEECMGVLSSSQSQLGLVYVMLAVKHTDYTAKNLYPNNGIIHNTIVFTGGGKMIHACTWIKL